MEREIRMAVAGPISFHSRRRRRLQLFVVLYVDPKGEAKFTFDYGWSRLGRYPQVLDVPSLEVVDCRQEFKEAELLRRYGTGLGKEDKWWNIDQESPLDRSLGVAITTDESQSLVRQCVKGALNEIGNELIPYFHSLIEFSQKEF